MIGSAAVGLTFEFPAFQFGGGTEKFIEAISTSASTYFGVGFRVVLIGLPPSFEFGSRLGVGSTTFVIVFDVVGDTSSELTSLLEEGSLSGSTFEGCFGGLPRFGLTASTVSSRR